MSTIKISALPAASTIDGSVDVFPISQTGVTNKISRNTFLGVTGQPADISTIQTFTNKTLTAPTISGPTFSGTLIGTYTIGGTPTFPASVVTLTGSQALTNKTITSPTITSPAITGTVSGSATYSTPTLTVPVIADFSSATHTHATTATGGTLSITAGGASSVLIDQSGLALDIEARANSTNQINWVESGCVWTAGVGALASMTAGVVWINGRRISVSSVSNHSFGAGSTDNYVDVGVTGALTFTAVGTNIGTGNTLAASSIRLAIVIMTGGSISSINQGAVSAVAPVISSNTLTVCDHLGNMIYNTSPTPSVIAYRQITTNFAPGAGTEADVTGLDLCPALIPVGRSVRVSFSGNIYDSTGAVSVIAKVKEGSTILGARRNFTVGANDPISCYCPSSPQRPTTGLHTYKTTIASTGTGAGVESNTSNAQYAFMQVELV